MTLLAPASNQFLVVESSPMVAHMKSLCEAKKFKVLKDAISTCEDQKIAQEIFQWLFHRPMLPACWDAYLNNPHLIGILNYKELKHIAKSVSQQLLNPDLDSKSRKACESILVTLASNSKWCEMLSYRFYLDFVHDAPALKEHIVYDEEFITHLDYMHVSLFFKQLTDPEHLDAILEFLDDTLDSQSHHYYWALETIKFAILHNESVVQAIFGTEKFLVIRLMLSATFNQDKCFATQVLQNVGLSKKFVSLENCRVYNHPLLNADDYKNIFESSLIKIGKDLAALKHSLESVLPVTSQPLRMSELQKALENIETADNTLLRKRVNSPHK